MKIGDDIHVPAALIPDEKPLVTTEEAAVWMSQQVWKLRISENALAPCWNVGLTSIPRSSGPYHSHRTD
jgi:hypothetical protein